MRWIALPIALSLLAGCSVGPDYKTPSMNMPAEYSLGVPATQPAVAQASIRATTRPTAGASTRPVDLATWWESLGDPELNSLVQRAVKANPDLQIALARLQEARTAQAIISGGSLPSLEASGGAGRGSGTNSTKNRISGPLNAGTNTTGLKELTEVVGFDAGWEVDLFGRYNRMQEAARYDTEAAIELRNDVLVALIADVARDYSDYRAGEMRLAIAREAIQTAQQTADLVRARYNRGLTNELDVALAQRQLATVQSRLAPSAAQLEDSQARLASLLGRFPQDLSKELQTPGPVPSLPPSIQAGVPVELLRRRPDIRASERELAAATARIGVATANLFPRLGITAGAGMQGQGLGREPEKTSFIWSAGPTAYWPLLDFGTLDATIDMQDLHTHEMLVNYKRTILNAVVEVDNAIGNYAAQQQRLQSLGEALAASERAVTLASQRYDRGLTDFLNVLDAQRQLDDLQDQYATAQESVVLQYISLYKGLGGGWETFQTIPPIQKPQPAILAVFNKPKQMN